MQTFMVERELKGIAMEDLAAAQKAAIAKGKEMTAAGVPVRYLRSTFSPEDGRCFCMFEANNAGAVEQLNEDAGIPFTRVVPALDLTP
jgi:hypothetical protein